MPRLFCFGLGYSAQVLAARAAASGFAVAGTVRNAEAAESLRRQGYEVHLFERGRELPAGVLDGTTHLLSSVPPDSAGDPVVDETGQDLRRIHGLLWAGYLSTTGVYGDRSGETVDEATPPAPTTERGARRLAAERAWAALGLPLHIFRLPGIYGPGRSAVDQIRAGTARAVVKPGHVFSRVHVEDIANALLASMAHPSPGAVYNVCDDEPAAPADVLDEAARVLGLPPLPRVDFAEANLSPMAQSFWSESKRVSNRRLHEELGVTLAYPTYREGLAAIAAGQEGTA